MKSFKYIYFLPLMLFCLSLAGCYEKFDDPAEKDLSEVKQPEGTTLVSILSLKNLVNDNNPVLDVTEDWVIQGKVSTTDLPGNFYRSFYIQDETSGIEIKVGKQNMHNDYKLGQTVWVKLKGLTLGYYRGMVSVGYAAEEESDYANQWIDIPSVIDEHVIKGRYGTPVTPIVVSSANEVQDYMLGMLVTFKGMENTGRIGFSFYYDNDGNMVTVSELDTWAIGNDLYNDDQSAGYGSHIFTLGGREFLIRTSGYSKFADELVTDRVEVGKHADVTAIFTRYRSNSNYDFDYQLVLNESSDVVQID